MRVLSNKLSVTVAAFLAGTVLAISLLFSNLASAGCDAFWPNVDAQQACEGLVQSLNAIKDIGDQVVVEGSATLGGMVKTTRDKLNNISTKAAKIGNTLDKAAEQLTKMQNSPSILTTIQDAKDLLQYQLEFQAGRLGAFLQGDCAMGTSTECGRLKTELVEMIGQLEVLMDVLIHLDGGDVLPGVSFAGAVTMPVYPHLDFSLLEDWIAGAPGIMLFPLNEALTQIGSGSSSGAESLGHLNEDMAEVIERISLFIEIVKAPALFTPPATALMQTAAIQEEAGELVPLCPWLLHPEARYRVEDDLPVVETYALLEKALGKFLIILSTTGIAPEGQIHGYIGASVTNEDLLKVGLILDGVGTFLLDIMATVRSKVSLCRAIMMRKQAIISNRNTAYMRCLFEKNLVSRNIPAARNNECSDGHEGEYE